MVDICTTYLGLPLAHPLIPGASPLVNNLDTVRLLEDAGAAAIVMPSLFEEQVRDDSSTDELLRASFEESFAEARNYLPRRQEYVVSADAYLAHLRRIKDAVGIPVIASLNGAGVGSWVTNAALMESAGADALELNIYYLPGGPWDSGADVERRVLELVREIRSQISIPLAVKLPPYFSSFCHLAAEIATLGADGVVLFNRPYQPDIDIEDLEVVPQVELSDSRELGLRLRWLAILREHLPIDLAVSGGVHRVEDAIKALMAGASVVQIVSAILGHGPEYLQGLRRELADWIERHGYRSLGELTGSMRLGSCPNPEAFGRSHYVRTLQIWRS
ncbi:MAG: dihydroorotate dehydrogenase-like protein [Puniceicoccaceae bacterium]|nr:MAG: dihydroorotate dehydrogenase-like protein [Puniceicoccaceae bacterium]